MFLKFALGAKNYALNFTYIISLGLSLGLVGYTV